MKKNDLITLVIDAIGFEGEGIARYDGATVFVPFALPSETVRARILKVKGAIAFAKMEGIIESSPARVQPKCSVFSRCGGCQLQHMEYRNQLEIKRDIVKTCFKKIAGLSVDVAPTQPSPEAWAYRNKLQLPLRRVNGVNVMGFFRPNSHNVVEISKCPLHPEWAEKVISAVKKYADERKVSFYDEASGEGLLKHLAVRAAGGGLIVALVATKRTIPAVNRLIDALSEHFDKFSLVLNVNDNPANAVFGGEFITLYGDGKIHLEELGVKYSAGIESFMQVNDGQKKNLYRKVIEAVGADEKTAVIDGYSGAGALTAALAKNAGAAFGVEIVPEASESANALAAANGLADKMKSYCGDAAELLPKLVRETVGKWTRTVLVLDPPRKGVSPSVLRAALEARPDKIVYVSCSPQTLARDAGVICGSLKLDGEAIVNAPSDECVYTFESALPFDMFPQTKHVETVCTFVKK